MHATLPLLVTTDFPAPRRRSVEFVQANLGYRCNRSCVHCHVNAGPQRQEEMSGETVEALIAFVAASPEVKVLDLTGGAPEPSLHFRRLVIAARARGLKVIDRCNLTILEEAGFADLAGFLAEHQVEVVASLPRYLEENVDHQRGKGTFAAGIRATDLDADALAGHAMRGADHCCGCTAGQGSSCGGALGEDTVAAPSCQA